MNGDGFPLDSTFDERIRQRRDAHPTLAGWKRGVRVRREHPA